MYLRLHVHALVRFREIKKQKVNRWLGSVSVILGHWAVFFDKWHLGAMRIIDFSAIAMVLIRFRAVAKVLSIPPLVLFGQCSLQIFCAHFLFCFLGIKMMGDGDRLFGLRQVALIAVTFATLFVVAKISVRTKRPKASDQPFPQESRLVRPAVTS